MLTASLNLYTTIYYNRGNQWQVLVPIWRSLDLDIILISCLISFQNCLRSNSNRSYHSDRKIAETHKAAIGRSLKQVRRPPPLLSMFVRSMWVWFTQPKSSESGSPSLSQWDSIPIEGPNDSYTRHVQGHQSSAASSHSHTALPCN